MEEQRKSQRQDRKIHAKAGAYSAMAVATGDSLGGAGVAAP